MVPPAFASALNLAGVPGVLQAIVGLEELRTGPRPFQGRCMFCPPCGVATSLLEPVPTLALLSGLLAFAHDLSVNFRPGHHSRAMALSVDRIGNNSTMCRYHRGSQQKGGDEQ